MKPSMKKAGIFLSLLLCLLPLCGRAQTVTLRLDSQPLKAAFKSIESQTGLSIIYKSDEVNDSKTITVSLADTPVKQAVESMVGEGLEVTIINKMIVVSRKAVTRNQAPAVTGQVTDENGSPLPGAMILVRGTSNGVQTGADGRFSLNGASPSDILEVSLLGFLTAEVPASSEHLGRIVLKEDRMLLDEVLVIGYGSQKKSDITGSVTSVKMSEILSAPAASSAQALQGRVAGVVVQNNSGEPSGNMTIRIRGANSLTYGNDPLIIIDGVQDGNLAGLNPNQIESMEVLKDAAALSVYGAKGANGVILVTTKNGERDKFSVTYNGYVSFDKVRRTLSSLDAWEYATLDNEARAANGLSAAFTAEEIASLGKGTDWQDEIFRNAISHSHNIGLSGGSKAVSYYLSGNILDRQGIIRNSGYRSWSFRGNFKIEATQRFNINFNTYASYDKSYRGETETALTAALQWSPTKTVYDADGKYTQPGGGVGPNSLYNPVALAEEIVNDSNNSSFGAALTGEYRFTDYLKFSSLLSYKTNSRLNGYFDNQVANNGPAQDVSGSKTQSRYSSLQSTNILTFDRTFGRHLVQATGVYEVLRDWYDATSASSKGIPAGMGYDGVHFGTVLQQPWVEHTTSTLESFMGRVNYSYDSRYMASASIRFDGASQLADGNKWDSFTAFSAGWNIVNESFMEQLRPVLSELKLRVSYGTVGNAAVPAYSSYTKFYPGLDANNNATLSVSQIGNENLKWERTKELNVGVESALYQDRITFSAEYYDKKTTDLLMWQSVPSALGVESVLTNVGSVSNKGFELTLGGSPVSSRDFSWTINWTLNRNDNKIVELDGLSDTIVYSSNADYPGLVGSFVQKVGQPMGTFLGYKYAGTWKTEEASNAALYGAKPGDAKYVDLNKDGVIDKDDIGVIGNAQPKWNYGFNNTFVYRHFDLNVFFQGVAGNHIYNQNRIRREAYTSDAFPTSTEIRKRWTADNQTDNPSFTASELVNSSRWVEKGDYLRLKNVTLGYRFPEPLLRKSGIGSLRVYVSGSNLWTITRYKGFDPESSMGTDAVAAGVDRGVYPSAKSLIAGVDITF